VKEEIGLLEETNISAPAGLNWRQHMLHVEKEIEFGCRR